MNTTKNLNKTVGIAKLKQLVETITTCFFCTDITNHNGSTATVMTAQEVDEEGTIWFFSGLDTDRNKNIELDKKVQLFFSDPSKNIYLVLNGEAEIVIDKIKMEKLWSPFLKIWFKEGINDTNISLIKVSSINAHYWDNEGGKMVNFIKMIASVVTGKDFVDAVEGKIKI